MKKLGPVTWVIGATLILGSNDARAGALETTKAAVEAAQKIRAAARATEEAHQAATALRATEATGTVRAAVRTESAKIGAFKDLKAFYAKIAAKKDAAILSTESTLQSIENPSKFRLVGGLTSSDRTDISSARRKIESLELDKKNLPDEAKMKEMIDAVASGDPEAKLRVYQRIKRDFEGPNYRFPTSDADSFINKLEEFLSRGGNLAQPSMEDLNRARAALQDAKAALAGRRGRKAASVAEEAKAATSEQKGLVGTQLPASDASAPSSTAGEAR